MEGAFFVHALIGVGAKVIPLGLQHIGVAAGGAVGIKVGQGTAQRHYGHTPFRGQRYYTTPAGPGFFQGFREEVAERRFFIPACFAKLSLTSSRNRARMMQPFRQILEI